MNVVTRGYGRRSGAGGAVVTFGFNRYTLIPTGQRRIRVMSREPRIEWTSTRLHPAPK